MKKYRILKAGRLYYPQWRYFFTWYNFYKELVGYECITNIVFDSERKAIQFLEENEVTYIPWRKG